MTHSTLHPARRAGQTSADGQLASLTSLRFFAALAVVVLHYRDLLGPLPAWLMRGIVGGQYGVTFFFILSGFILTYRYHAWFSAGVQDGSFWRFQRFRLARIYPVYVLGLLLDTPWHLLERAQVGQLGAAGATYWASWLLNLVGLQAWMTSTPFAMFWNTPAWSVSAEFFFYASFPFLCSWIARRLRSGRALALMFAGVVVAGVALYAAVIHLLGQVLQVSAETQYLVLVYNPLLRYSEFFAGCLAGTWFLRERASGRSTFLGDGPARTARRDVALVVCMLLVGLRIWTPDYTGPEMWRWLLDVAMKYGIFIVPFTGIILAVAAGPTFLTRLLEHPWLVVLGEASYALYIIHWSVTTFLRMGYLGSLASPALHLAFLLGTVAASVVCYRFVEVPWRERLRGSAARGASQPGEPTGRPQPTLA